MSCLIVVDRENEEHIVEATQGLTLMEIVKNAGLDVEAICGGQCVCSTCHVYIDKKWLEQLDGPSEEEQIMVEDTGYYQNNSRLSCQVVWDHSIDGIRISLAPVF